jgi:GAF domain-containing protein
VNQTAIAIAAVLGGLVLLLLTLLLLIGRRSRRRADERVGAVVETLEKRMDELAQELAGAVERAEEEARRSRFLGELVVFDVDDFKDVNDKIGHLAGDAVLSEAAARVREVLRSADVPCRVGGDEFALGQAGRLEISAGVAELRAEDDSSRSSNGPTTPSTARRKPARGRASPPTGRGGVPGTA